MLSELVLYLKTTETCQLNCSHCFTGGMNGAKGFFDPEKTASFLKRLKAFRPQLESGSISFHGGEPMLCPTDHMFSLWNDTKDLWGNVWWSMQTNLTYKLTEKKVDVLEKICQKHWGTSYDHNIRWDNKRQQDLWASNIKELVAQGHVVNVIVSVSKEMVETKEPIEIIDYIASLGASSINFERITENGNALLAKENTLIPTNFEQDKWFKKMWDQSIEHKTYKYIKNLFFDSVLSSYTYQTFSGCRCRQCEQKVLTINANGTIGGCPNTAPDMTFGHINDPIESILGHEKRMCNIQQEAIRPTACMSCEVYDICNGDCYQLAWEDGVCGAPKSFMQNLKQQNNHALYKDFLQGFMGQE